MRNLDQLGPRFIVKRDSESSVGRGCDLRTAHFRPEMAAIIWACGQGCMSLDTRIKEVWITEGARSIRDSRDLHEELRAFDFTLRREDGTRSSEVVMRRVGAVMGKLLGPDYQIIVHGEGLSLHIHAEIDPR